MILKTTDEIHNLTSNIQGTLKISFLFKPLVIIKLKKQKTQNPLTLL